LLFIRFPYAVYECVTYSGHLQQYLQPCRGWPLLLSFSKHRLHASALLVPLALLALSADLVIEANPVRNAFVARMAIDLFEATFAFIFTCVSFATLALRASAIIDAGFCGFWDAVLPDRSAFHARVCARLCSHILGALSASICASPCTIRASDCSIRASPSATMQHKSDARERN